MTEARCPLKSRGQGLSMGSTRWIEMRDNLSISACLHPTQEPINGCTRPGTTSQTIRTSTEWRTEVECTLSPTRYLLINSLSILSGVKAIRSTQLTGRSALLVILLIPFQSCISPKIEFHLLVQKSFCLKRWTAVNFSMSFFFTSRVYTGCWYFLIRWTCTVLQEEFLLHVA